jgi:hypothetical protein
MESVVEGKCTDVLRIFNVDEPCFFIVQKRAG